MPDRPDQNDDQKPRIVPPAATLPSSSPASATTRQPLLTETFEVLPNPTIDELIRVAAKMANFLNLYCAEALRARIVTASNPGVMAMLNASANLEQGAIAQRQQVAAMAAGQFAAPGQGGPPPGAPPFRMN